ncbi:tRNA-dihydrouridine synthase [Planctobacterium marinum]|uniref:tRNA-dihydrouridine synthase n=1 Tax=Planctobacterium marinum TaxID=1631968 RepID=UPI001E463C6A|nr:tRNA-dihydrouridine synthase [Planctobacterium marinum]MCC2607478.1 tRNA-dihydrouridine synthase [Planctobacterium marinum]
MEGVVDHLMRDMLTRIGGYDICVTEFVRVVDALLPAKVFTRLCPELHNGGLTPAGTPVRVQLLGQNPEALAANACRAVELGSHGVDLNFGCPAKTVNKHRGGAVLLKDTESLYQILKAVRQAVPAHQIVSAKMRLGFDDKSLAVDNALALQEGGADMLVIHARTKREGYNPPAYWDWIARIKEKIDIPIVANGEIWTVADAKRCAQQSGCQDLMLGRGALAHPGLALSIRQGQPEMHWQAMLQLLIQYSGYELYGAKGKYYPNRVKQWLRYLQIQFPEARVLFEAVRRLQTAKDIVALLKAQSDFTANHAIPDRSDLPINL